jgi:hypothetical protein
MEEGSLRGTSCDSSFPRTRESRFVPRSISLLAAFADMT